MTLVPLSNVLDDLLSKEDIFSNVYTFHEPRLVLGDDSGIRGEILSSKSLEKILFTKLQRLMGLKS